MEFLPIIKWIGSKRLQSGDIVKFFPNEMETYYEPFCGGCSVMFQLMLSEEFNVGKYICSDTNKDLIDLWNTILTDPNGLFDEYTTLWNEMNTLGDRQMKRKFFEEVREEFNINRSPYLFFFLMRTTTNGIPRYNKLGNFNNTYHLTRDGMTPEKLEKIFERWCDKLSMNNVEFLCCDYKDILDMATHNDFIYFDPPYEITRSTGKWTGVNVDYFDLFDQLRILTERDIKWALSYDMDNGSRVIPMDCYLNMTNINGKLGGYRKTKQRMSDDSIY